MSKVTIDGIVYEVDPANNLLEECLAAGIDLPYFCWHPSMGSVGSCRQCAVIEYADENDTRGKLVMSCMTPPRDGARYSVANAAKFRAEVIESLMTSHPHDCPVCEEGGECHLQDMTVMSGHTYRRYRGKKVTHRNQDLGPFIGHEMNRCITCYRCVRFYNDYAGGTDLSALASHNHTYFGRYEEGTLESEFSGNLAEVCPTGVFTDKVFSKHYVRKWDLQTSPSICAGCSVGCNINPGERYGTLRRIVNRYNEEVNGYFLCDRGRFGTGYVNEDARIRDSMTRENSHTDPVLATAEQALASLHELQGSIGIGSPRASMEANFALRNKVGAGNFYAGFSDAEFALMQQVLDIYQQAPVDIPSIKDMEAADVVVVLGEDVTNTAARIALALRQSVRNKSFEMAAEKKIPLWQDAAVRTLAMEARSPLYILSPHATRLDDVATEVHISDYNETAAIAAAIARHLDSKAPAVKGLDKTAQALAKKIAADIKAARKPLIISGTNSMSPLLLQAAANLAVAAGNEERRAGLALVGVEANSMGLALMMQGSDNNLDKAFASRARSAIVLENDLYRRAPTKSVDDFIQGLEKLVVLDSIKTATGEQAHLVCATATFAESSGTFVNYEGRAQHYYATFRPVASIVPATRWLAPDVRLAELTRECAESIDHCRGMLTLTPGEDFNVAGLQVPRQQHRYSGRTAMRAHLNVHEPKQEQDEDGIMNYSMEGISPLKDVTVFNTAWAPGWNSNQAVIKFQDEAGGHLKQSLDGHMLLADGNAGGESGTEKQYYPMPAFEASGGMQSFPLYHLFGSEELSACSAAIRSRAPLPYVALSETDAQRLELKPGDVVRVDRNGVLPCVIRKSLRPGMVGLSAGLAGFNIHNTGANVSLSKAENWQRPEAWGTDNIIVSDLMTDLPPDLPPDPDKEAN